MPSGDDFDEATLVNQAHVRPWGRLSLVVLVEGAYQTYTLPDVGRIAIGRGPQADLQIDNKSVSRVHAVLHLGARLAVEDAGSVNGTFVRDERLAPGTPVEILPGEPIAVGAVIVMVQSRLVEPPALRIMSHGYFEARLEEAVALAEDNDDQLAVMRIHVDGDMPARQVQEILARSLRRGDVVGSYGPRDYEVLLIGATSDSAAALRAQIGDAFAETRAPVQVRVACYPRDGRDPYSLAERLSAAAYESSEGEPEPQPIVLDGAMRQIHRLVAQVAASPLSVLVLGETGVGKEVIAEAIHKLSPRAKAPLVRLNCAALSETLLESELFGHEKGAFTGAVAARPGHLEAGDGGTIFLDEVGELPMSTQVKLLRVIESREVMRVGAVKPRTIDVRFIGATNRDLDAEIVRGTFRQDLFFRLNGFTLVIPPLRQRVSEIEGLARSFVRQSRKLLGRKEDPELAPEALALLKQYAWPGNIRELKNMIERAVLLAKDGRITPEELPVERMRDTFTRRPSQVEMTRPAAPPPPPPGDGDDPERARIVAALEKFAGNQTRAAQFLGISRRTLINRIEVYQISRPRK